MEGLESLLDVPTSRPLGPEASCQPVTQEKETPCPLSCHAGRRDVLCVQESPPTPSLSRSAASALTEIPGLHVAVPPATGTRGGGHSTCQGSPLLCAAPRPLPGTHPLKARGSQGQPGLPKVQPRLGWFPREDQSEMRQENRMWLWGRVPGLGAPRFPDLRLGCLFPIGPPPCPRGEPPGQRGADQPAG